MRFSRNGKWALMTWCHAGRLAWLSTLGAEAAKIPNNNNKTADNNSLLTAGSSCDTLTLTVKPTSSLWLTRFMSFRPSSSLQFLFLRRWASSMTTQRHCSFFSSGQSAMIISKVVITPWNFSTSGMGAACRGRHSSHHQTHSLCRWCTGKYHQIHTEMQNCNTLIHSLVNDLF